MSTVDEIKAAAARLSADEQYQLFHWWVETTTFKQRQIAALKQEILDGLNQLESGHYTEYSDQDVMKLAEEIGQAGQRRLGRQKP